MKNLSSSIALASLLLAGAATGCADESTSETAQAVKCQGINECKGTSECAGPGGANDCQGLNDCAGMGWVSVETKEECAEKGGTVI